MCVSCECCVLSGRGLCEGPIPRLEARARLRLRVCVCGVCARACAFVWCVCTYACVRMCVCVWCVCARAPRSELSCSATEREKCFTYLRFSRYLHGRVNIFIE
jgi:hypothetical protein